MAILPGDIKITDMRINGDLLNFKIDVTDYVRRADVERPIGPMYTPYMKALDDADPDAEQYRQIVSRIDLSMHPYRIGISIQACGGPTLSLTAIVPDIRDGNPTTVMRTDTIPAAMNEKDFLGFVRHCLHVLVTHEVDEAFTYAGERIFDPHRNGKP